MQIFLYVTNDWPIKQEATQKLLSYITSKLFAVSRTFVNDHFLNKLSHIMEGSEKVIKGNKNKIRHHFICSLIMAER